MLFWLECKHDPKWNTGQIKYFNTKLKSFFIDFDDSSDIDIKKSHVVFILNEIRAKLRATSTENLEKIRVFEY